MAGDQLDRDANQKQSTQATVLSALTTVAGIIVALVSLLVYLYQIANGGVRLLPLIVAVLAGALICLAGWRLLKRARPRAVIVPLVVALVLLVSSDIFAASRPLGTRVTGVNPHGASVIGMRRLPTNAPGPHYLVDVKVVDRPPSDRSLWLVSVLYAEPGKLKDTLYYAKAPVPSTKDTYHIEIQFCHALVTDLQRGLQVVAANAAESKILAKNRYEEDNCIKNSDMTDLAGAMPVSDAYKFYASP